MVGSAGEDESCAMLLAAWSPPLLPKISGSRHWVEVTGVKRWPLREPRGARIGMLWAGGRRCIVQANCTWPDPLTATPP
jgi:hypothetical protein